MVKRRVEAWGGVECTLNRVDNTYFDQLEWSGHRRRLDDIGRFAELGISALRFPILWEHCDAGDWSWNDAALERLNKYNIRPIAGLLHHGSGPPWTNLLDPAFPKRFSEFASRVASRYPSICDYTPINEPMTTARFSALYGLWYPHRRSHADFLRALIHEIRATVLAMRAIRRVQPRAKLIQTEDFGRTYSTAALAPLASDLNERRWLTPDLLCGRLQNDGAMWRYLLRSGIPEEELTWFAQNPCPPDVIGVNHYLTSDRFLDDAIELYPHEPAASAGPFRFVDLDAVRRCGHCDLTTGGVLRDAWNRFAIPVAVTEAHLGCTREEQMRWLAEVMFDAQALADEGVDVRAVTAWSLLGAFNWNVLVTRDAGYYESGVFDVLEGTPRPTALVAMVRTFAEGRMPDHPVLDTKGWWRRPERLLHSASQGRSYCSDAGNSSDVQNQLHVTSPQSRKLWIVNGETEAGRAVTRACESRGIDYVNVTGEKEIAVDCWAMIICGESHPLRQKAKMQNLPLLLLSPEPAMEDGAGSESSLRIATSSDIDAALNGLIDGLLPDGCDQRCRPLERRY